MPIVVTGRDSPAVRRRIADLGIGHAAYGAADKLGRRATPCSRRLGLGWDRVAAMGDDWPDLPLLRRAAFACAPPQAHIEVRAAAHHVTAGARPASAPRASSATCCWSPSGRYAELLARPARSPSMARDEVAAEPVSDGFDDDEVDLSFAGPEPVAAAPWPMRLLDLVSAYLPLLLMATLAAGTWWLVAQRAVGRRAARRGGAASRGRLRHDALRRPALRQRRRRCAPRSRATGCVTIPTTTRSRSTRRGSARSAATAR